MMVKYVEYAYPGILFSEMEAEKTNITDPVKMKHRKGSYAFRFFEREEAQGIYDLLVGLPKNHSGWYFYPGSKVMTLAQVKKQMPTEKILISNMTINKWPKVVKTVTGNVLVFQDKDRILK